MWLLHRTGTPLSTVSTQAPSPGEESSGTDHFESDISNLAVANKTEMSSKEFFSQVTERQKHLYNKNSAFQHRRFNSHTVKLVSGISIHERGTSHLKLAASGPFVGLDSLCSQEVPKKDQEFLSLLETAISYFSSEEVPALTLNGQRLRELEHSQELYKSEILRLKSALDAQLTIMNDYEQKAYLLTRNLIKLESTQQNAEQQLKLEKAKNQELVNYLTLQSKSRPQPIIVRASPHKRCSSQLMFSRM